MTYSFIDSLKDAEIDALKKELSALIENLAPSDFIALYNEYAGDNNYERIYENDDYTVNTLLGEDCTPWDAVNQIEDGYRTNQPYCMFNGRGLLESGDNPYEMAYMSDDTLAEFIIDKADDFYIDDITEILDKYDDIGEVNWKEELGK